MRTGKQRAGRAINPAYGLGDDVAAADVVRRIFAEFTRLYVPGSLSEIAAGLNADAIPTAKGKRWYPSTVKYIVTNAAYVDLVGAELFDQAQRRLERLRPGPPR